jgi:hypothetical protein
LIAKSKRNVAEERQKNGTNRDLSTQFLIEMLVNMINGSSARSMLLMVLSGVTLLCETVEQHFFNYV